MNKVSSSPRKQHRSRAKAPFHRRGKEIKVHLDSSKYGNLPVSKLTVRKGDTVRILRGSRTGLEGKVSQVNIKSRKLSVEKALIRKSDNKEVPLWFDPSNLIITKIDLTDPVRKETFKMLSEEG
ncbi:MAG: 50S ribosomal protein L24 [Candidatus Thermoplasmatota archaeon]|nr:50S ribosomal protein L24 [Candidatus Thermoplasmatota archaeon]